MTHLNLDHTAQRHNIAGADIKIPVFLPFYVRVRVCVWGVAQWTPLLDGRINRI